MKKRSSVLIVLEVEKSRSLVLEPREGSHNITGKKKKGRESERVKEKAGRAGLAV